MNSQLPKARRKPGPKSKGAPKLEQLTVRLDPKIRFGLELMSRANHQSLAQSVEWAVRIAMQTVKVNSTGTIGTLVDIVSSHESPTALLYRLWELEPNLLTFEERAMIRLINLADDLYVEGEDKSPGTKSEFAKIDFVFLDKHAEQLRNFARLASEIGNVDGWKHLRKLLSLERKDMESEKRAQARAAKKAARNATDLKTD